MRLRLSLHFSKRIMGGSLHFSERIAGGLLHFSKRIGVIGQAWRQVFQLWIGDASVVHRAQTRDKHLFTTSTSRKLSGDSFIRPCAICPSIILLTRFDIVSSLYSFRLLEAASVASAIMSNDVSLLRGFGPGYVKGSGRPDFRRCCCRLLCRNILRGFCRGAQG